MPQLDDFASHRDRIDEMSVLQMHHRLDAPPVRTQVERIAIRTFTPQDVSEWLALRERAFATELPPVRPWNVADFAREMTDKPWWRDERTWLASPAEKTAELIGAVTLAMRQDTPVVQWLMVDPAWRRRGIGRTLIEHLEEEVWNCGMREVHLETHTQWDAAVQLYRQIGFEPLFPAT